MLKNGLNRQNRGVLFCAATLAMGVGACADVGDVGDIGEVESASQALESGPKIVGVDRDEDPSASDAKGGPKIVGVERDEDPSASSAKGGPKIVGVERDESPSGSSSHGGPSIGTVTRNDNPTGSNSGGGPRIVGVDRDDNPEGGKGPTSVTREPVVPGRPPVSSTPGDRPAEPPSRLDGPFYASVTANGSGCPAGTWHTALAEDGKTFTITFSGYSAFVSPSQSVNVKNCTLTIKLKSPGSLELAVQSFHFAGYAFLEDGLNAKQTAKYYLSGHPDKSIDAETELNGPFNRTYTLHNTVPLGREVWSECGTERDLIVQTNMRLKNGDPAGTGYVNLAAVTGSTQAVVRVSWRRCDSDKPSVPSTPATPGGPSIVGGSRDDNPTSGPASSGGPTVSSERDATTTAPSGDAPGISVERT